MPVYLPVFAFLLSGAANGSLQPMGKWNLDAAENACVLEHRFGTSDQGWSVGFKPHMGFPRSDVVLIGPKDWNSGREDAAIVTLRPSGVTFSGDSEVTALEGGAAMRRVSVENALLDAVATSTELVVSTKHHPPVSFALPGAAGAFAALKSCGEQLLKSWGVDLARFRPTVLRGQPGFVDLAQYISADDYPASAMHADGRTATLLSLDAEGKVKECRVTESSGTPALDTRTCEIAISRMRFPPARDSAGQKVESWTTLAIRWTAPPR